MENKINPQINQLLNRVKSSNIKSQFRPNNLKRQNQNRLQSLSLKKRKIKGSLHRDTSLKGFSKGGENIEGQQEDVKTKKAINNQPEFNLRKNTKYGEHNNLLLTRGYLRRPLGNLTIDQKNKLKLSARNYDQNMSKTIHVHQLMGRGQLFSYEISEKNENIVQNDLKNSDKQKGSTAFINAKQVNEIFHYVKQRTISQSQPIYEFTEIIFKLVCYYFVSFINQNRKDIEFDEGRLVEFVERQLSQSYYLLKSVKGLLVKQEQSIKGELKASYQQDQHKLNDNENKLKDHENKLKDHEKLVQNTNSLKNKQVANRNSKIRHSKQINIDKNCIQSNEKNTKKEEQKQQNEQNQEVKNLGVRRERRMSSFFKQVQENNLALKMGNNSKRRSSFSYGVNINQIKKLNQLREKQSIGFNPIIQEANNYGQNGNENEENYSQENSSDSQNDSCNEYNIYEKKEKKYKEKTKNKELKNNLQQPRNSGALLIGKQDAKKSILSHSGKKNSLRESALIMRANSINNFSQHQNQLYSSSSIVSNNQHLTRSKTNISNHRPSLMIDKNHNDLHKNNLKTNKKSQIYRTSQIKNNHAILQQQNLQLAQSLKQMTQKVQQLSQIEQSLETKIQQKDEQLHQIQNRISELNKQKQDLQIRVKETQEFTKSQQCSQMIQTVIKKKKQITDNLNLLIEAHAWYGSNLSQNSHIQHIITTKQSSLQKVNLITRRFRTCKQIQELEPIIGEMKQAFLVTIEKYTQIVEELQQKLVEAQGSRSSVLKSLEDWEIQRKVKQRIFNGCVVDYYTVERRIASYVKKVPEKINTLQHLLFVMEQHLKKSLTNNETQQTSHQNSQQSINQLNKSKDSINNNYQISKSIELEKQVFANLQKMLYQNEEITAQLERQKRFAMILEKIV